MKPLTENDFESVNFYHSNDEVIRCSQELIDYVLKNQEKAEKYDKIVMQGTLPLVEVTNALEIVERLKKLQTHPYNFGERIMEGLQFEIEGKTKFRQLLTGLIFAELQKILECKV